MGEKSYLRIGWIFLWMVILAACTTPTIQNTLIPATSTKAAATNTPPLATITPVSATDTPIPYTQTATATRVKVRTPTPRHTATNVPTEMNASECQGSPGISLHTHDWVMVSTDPPLSNKMRSQPGSNGELIGQIQPGENVLILDGPQCVDGYTWWYVRSLQGLEGWTVEGDATGYWLVNPISPWYQLPQPIKSGGTRTYNLREISISADTALVDNIDGNFLPLATPLPRPQTEETPDPDDPRYSEFGSTNYAAHSFYGVSGRIGDYIWIYDLTDPLSRFYLNNMSYNDCTEALRDTLENPTIEAGYLKPFCGINGGIPLLFKAGIKLIEFTGGKGVRYLMASGNYQTVNHLEYRFQGLSDDGRYYISSLIRPFLHPYILENEYLREDFGWILAWKDGQYDEAQKTYDLLNARVEELLNAGVVTLYPALEYFDAMMASIVIK